MSKPCAWSQPLVWGMLTAGPPPYRRVTAAVSSTQRLQVSDCRNSEPKPRRNTRSFLNHSPLTCPIPKPFLGRTALVSLICRNTRMPEWHSDFGTSRIKQKVFIKFNKFKGCWSSSVLKVCDSVSLASYLPPKSTAPFHLSFYTLASAGKRKSQANKSYNSALANAPHKKGCSQGPDCLE